MHSAWRQIGSWLPARVNAVPFPYAASTMFSPTCRKHSMWVRLIKNAKLAVDKEVSASRSSVGLSCVRYRSRWLSCCVFWTAVRRWAAPYSQQCSFLYHAQNCGKTIVAVHMPLPPFAIVWYHSRSDAPVPAQSLHSNAVAFCTLFSAGEKIARVVVLSGCYLLCLGL